MADLFGKFESPDACWWLCGCFVPLCGLLYLVFSGAHWKSSPRRDDPPPDP